MSRRGCFGKYGDIKRRDCLRHSGLPVLPIHQASIERRPAHPQPVKISIRRADPSDKEFISSLSGKVFSVYGPYEVLATGWFESELTWTFVAFEKGRSVGFAMMGRLFDDRENRNRCELLAIAVEPNLQRRGVGGMLLRKIEEEAQRLGEASLFLHTALNNLPAQALFRKNQFTSLVLKKHFYPGGQHALMMTKVF